MTGALAAAVWKQGGKQTPRTLPRVKRENIAAMVRKAITRIEQQRLPAALMVLSRWAERGAFDLSHIGSRWMSRRVSPSSLPSRSWQAAANIPDVPRVFDDLGGEAWTDASRLVRHGVRRPCEWATLRGAFRALERPAAGDLRHQVARPASGPSPSRFDGHAHFRHTIKRARPGADVVLDDDAVAKRPNIADNHVRAP
jgi:hypothetical protein